MSKTSSKKTASAPMTKIPSAFADKDADIVPAGDNPSKYQPTAESTLDIQALDDKDGVMKLFTDSLKDLYWAENHLVKSLPKMISAAASKKLQAAITDHLKQTKGHVSRLEKAFALLSIKAQAKKCDAMEGLSKEGEGIVECTDPGTTARDLGIIMASQKVEHYEISAYSGLVKLAGRLDLGDVADLLSQTLSEEKQADDLLADIADNQIEIQD